LREQLSSSNHSLIGELIRATLASAKNDLSVIKLLTINAAEKKRLTPPGTIINDDVSPS